MFYSNYNSNYFAYGNFNNTIIQYISLQNTRLQNTIGTIIKIQMAWLTGWQVIC